MPMEDVRQWKNNYRKCEITHKRRLEEQKWIENAIRNNKIQETRINDN